MQIKKVRLPRLSIAREVCETTQGELDERHGKLIQKLDQQGFTHVLVFGDRERFANLSYLTGGYDSRFEETLLVVAKDKTPLMIVGNEGASYSNISRLRHNIELFQTFSLQGQTRDKKKRLHTVLRCSGIGPSSKVGLVGTKYFEVGEVKDPLTAFDIPHYIVEEILEIVPKSSVSNVTHWFTHPYEGFRTTLSPHEIARFEYMGTYLSEAVHALLKTLRPGITETKLASSFEYRGFPFPSHPVVSFGEEAVLLGLASPRPSVALKSGDPVSIAFGVQGANLARTGLAVSSAKELLGNRKGIVEEFYFPYFEGNSNVV